ncbi:MAG: hypothetical protein M0007_03545 [Actinomycetota bacterium]|jgi:hypothetical protein|nr:hypothetical protein [Actinomycetota bacterium]
MARLRAAAVFAVLLTLLTACGVDCSLAGCFSGVTVELEAFPVPPQPSTAVTVCVDRHCSTEHPGATPLGAATAMTPTTGAEKVRVSIKIVGPDGSLVASDATTVRLHKNQPNGPSCGPTCYDAVLVLNPQGRLVA